MPASSRRGLARRRRARRLGVFEGSATPPARDLGGVRRRHGLGDTALVHPGVDLVPELVGTVHLQGALGVVGGVHPSGLGVAPCPLQVGALGERSAAGEAANPAAPNLEDPRGMKNLLPFSRSTDHATDHIRLSSSKCKGRSGRKRLGYAMGGTGVEPVTSCL